MMVLFKTITGKDFDNVYIFSIFEKTDGSYVLHGYKNKDAQMFTYKKSKDLYELEIYANSYILSDK